ncbi:chorismate synthase [Clostridia bacterium]|nr:chorismate synthase [Clostridia bacterium]
MNIWGEKLKISLFGESHGTAIGVVIDGLPHGFKLDCERIATEMARRAPGQSDVTTSRRESDKVEILSGLLNNITTGAPLCGIIRNVDARSYDYALDKLRPGHADWTAFLKFNGHADMRGGGAFSGRLTAPLTFAGAVARQFLDKQNIIISTESDVNYDEILHVKSENDSIGGVIELTVENIPEGLGGLFFGAVESRLSSLLFSIPAVKGVEFGDGFRFATMRGSEANDQLCLKNGRIFAHSNHNGGVLGGITNGLPLIARVAIKPTPSIGLPQKTVDVSDMRETTITVGGRHDPCIVPRAMPVVEAAAAVCILDLILCSRSDGEYL